MTTFVTFLLDRSGSMEAIKNDTIGAFNAYVGGLKEAPNTVFSLVQFDTMSIEKVYVRVSTASIPDMTTASFQPRGGTPLIDAAYRTIKAVEESGVGAIDKVVICIQTDGEENSSREYTWEQLNALIKAKIALGWQFNFLGASIDAYRQGSLMGIPVAATMSYNSLDAGATKTAFVGRARATAAYASGAKTDMLIPEAEKTAAGDVHNPNKDFSL